MVESNLPAIADPAYQAQISGLKQMTAWINEGIARQTEQDNSLVSAQPTQGSASMVETPLS